MINFIFKTVFLISPCFLISQSVDNSSESYIQLYGGWGFQGSIYAEQIGVAHKRGDFNEFDTDFDLQIQVNGKSDGANLYTTGFVLGHVWKKNKRNWSPGFELDLSRSYSKYNSNLVNEEDQKANNINGNNSADVIALVQEYYGKDRHNFSNTMNMEAWNIAGNIALSIHINPKVSMYSGLGFGLSNVVLKDAISLQTSPAKDPPGYETTSDNGGDPVNHFNGRPNASSMLFLGQASLGTKISLSKKAAFIIETRSFYRGKGTFVFGSTQYSDHAPTDHWTFSTGKGMGIMVNIGIMFSL